MLGHEFREVRFGERAFAGRVQDASGAFHVGLTKGLGFLFGYRYQQYDYIDPTTAATTQCVPTVSTSGSTMARVTA
jgi:hypothetical protein